MRPGIHDDMPLADYLAAPGINKSGLAAFARSPARYRYGEPQTTRSQALGRLAHTVILEPSQVARRFCVSDLATFNENHSAFRREEERAMGRELVKRPDFEAALRMRDGIMKHPVARELLKPGPDVAIERSFAWTDPETGLLCRGRADLMRTASLVMADVKSTRDARIAKFRDDAYQFRYHWQHPMYLDGYALATDGAAKPVAFVLIAVEPEPPFLAAAFEYTPAAVEFGRLEVARTMREYRRCFLEDRWPGHPEHIQDLGLPPHVRLRSAPYHIEEARR